MRSLMNIAAALVAAVVLASACSNPAEAVFSPGDGPAEAQRYTDGAGTYWCQLPNGSRYPTQ